MLALEVTYLSGRVYAADVRDRSQIEWPPHPARLFSALVAAMYSSGAVSPEEREVLRWLEQQGPPALYCPSASVRQPVVVYVPVNDPEHSPKDRNPLPQARNRQPRFFPSATLGDSNSVYFIWLSAQCDEVKLGVLARLARRVGYLGTSSSLVGIRIVDECPEANLVPDNTGLYMLRVPYSGLLNDLEENYRLGVRPAAGKWQGYRAVTEVIHGNQSIFREVIPLKFENDRPTLEGTLTLTDALRRAVIASIPEPVPPEVHGHDRIPHCAYVPLAYVGSEHADGSVLGAAVLLPVNVSFEVRNLILRALGSLKKLWLTRTFSVDISLITPAVRQRTLLPERWQGPACEWATVTPVVFGHFPKRRGKTAEEIIAVNCAQIGLPRPIGVRVAQWSPLKGVPPARAFRVTRKPDEPKRFIAHVQLSFAEPVRGPVILGCMRHFGLGLCAPLYQERMRV